MEPATLSRQLSLRFDESMNHFVKIATADELRICPLGMSDDEIHIVAASREDPFCVVWFE